MTIKLVVILAWVMSFVISMTVAIVPSATIQSPYIRLSDPSEVINRRIYEGYGNPNYYRISPKRSYVIYEDFRHMPPSSDGRIEGLGQGSTRAWHLQFNRQLQQSQKPPTSSNNHYGHQSVYSNLIQIVDDPAQRKYYGPNDGKAYFDNNKRFTTLMKPVEVPKYDVVYPFESQRDNIYYNDKLPEKFPPPFHPDRNFHFMNPRPVDVPRRDMSFFRTHTISYPNSNNDLSQKRDVSSRPCNYIRLNDKGFPVRNELCGRSISDIILEDDYPITGELVLEHRKRYRGVYSENNFQPVSRTDKDENKNRRQKRSPDYMPRRFGSGYSCCNDYGKSMYSDYQPYDIGYSNRFVSRPYQGYRESGSYGGGYGYRNRGGQSYDDDDDFGEETSSNSRGLASYLKRGRGGDRMQEDKDSDENDNSRESQSTSNYNNNNNDRNKSNRNSNHNNDQSNNSRRNQGNNNNSRNENQANNNSTISNRNRGSSRNDRGGKRQQSHVRGSGGVYDDYDSSYSNQDSYRYNEHNNNRNGGNNYDYVRSNDNGWGYGTSGYRPNTDGYSGGVRSSGGYLGQGSFNGGRYNSNGYSSVGYNAGSGLYGRNSGFGYDTR